MMSKFLYTFAILSVVSLLVVRAEEEKKDEQPDAEKFPHVHFLTDATFDDFIAKESENQPVLVAFIASFCGHCTRAKPAMNDAAKQLEPLGLKIAAIDAQSSTNPKTSSKFRIDGYPSLRLFRQGEVVEDFEGERTEAGFVEYMKKKAAEPVNKEITTTKEFRDLTKLATLPVNRIVGVFSSKQHVDYKIFKAVALQYAASGVEIYHTASASVLENIGFFGSGSAITMYRPNLKPAKVMYKGTLFKQDFADWIVNNILPADQVLEYTEKNAKLFDKTGDNVVRVITDGSNPAVVQSTLTAALKANKEIRFATAKLEDFEKDAERECGADVVKQSKICVIGKYGSKTKGGKAGSEYGLDAAFTASAFDKFLDKFIKKELKAKVKSQPVPSEEPTAGKTVVVVGKTFDELVLNADKHVFLFFGAAFCGHCRAAAPKYDDLAAAMGDRFNEIAIAKIDLEANELQPEAKKAFKVEGFPTFWLSPKGNHLNPIAYEGGRDVESWKKFIEANI